MAIEPSPTMWLAWFQALALVRIQVSPVAVIAPIWRQLQCSSCFSSSASMSSQPTPASRRSQRRWPFCGWTVAIGATMIPRSVSSGVRCRWTGKVRPKLMVIVVDAIPISPVSGLLARTV